MTTKERPILFGSPMVKAILDGRKTQTRRVVFKDDCQECHQPWWCAGKHWQDGDELLHCPYGQAGDRLWVRETWQAQNLDRQWWHEVKREDRTSMNWAWTNPVERAYLPMPPRWLPAIHMPRMACRITLEIVKVRAERLQDISGEDCVAEGIDCLYEPDTNVPADHYTRQTFAQLWNSINTSRGYGWDINPWVWVIEFKLVTP